MNFWRSGHLTGNNQMTPISIHMIANVSAAYAKDNKKALHLREHLKGEEF
jgi:hypothetical protein